MPSRPRAEPSEFLRYCGGGGGGGGGGGMVNCTVTVMTTGTGAPFSSVGVYSHCLTASSAA